MMPANLPGPLKDMNKPMIIGLAVILLLLTAGGLYAAFFSDNVETIDSTAVATIYKDQFASTVQVQGTVKTSQDMDVYTSQTAPVKEVFVDENESVREGQVLAILDDGSLRDQIAIKEAASGVSARSAAAQVQAAENRYNAARRALAQGTNAALVSAETNVHVAYQNWQSSQKAYEDFQRSIAEGYHPELAGQDTSSEGTQASLRNAQNSYEQAKAEVDRNRERLAKARADKNYYDNERSRLRNEVNDLQIKLTEAQSNSSSYNALLAQKEQAQVAYDIAKANDLDPENPSLETQKAYASLQIAEKLLEGAAKGSEIDKLTKELNNRNFELSEAESEYSKAVANESAYEDSQAGLDNAAANAKVNLENLLAQSKRNQTSSQRTKANLQDQLSSMRQSADAAKQAYNDAQRARAAAQAAANDEFQTLADNVRTTAAAGDNSVALVELAKMWEDLEEMTIRAPVAGVVTQIHAEVGMIPTGSLFKIESTNDLLIETELKEFDVNSVKEDMRVEIKTDATGDQVFTGKVVSIAPVSSQHASQGSNTFGGDDSGQPTFKTIVAINGNPTQLKAGMEARLTIILSEEEEVLAVPFASVYEKNDGQSAVLVARPKGGRSNRYELKEVHVETGLENDLAIVVTGNLYDGDQILLNPADYSEGQVVQISEGNAEIS